MLKLNYFSIIMSSVLGAMPAIPQTSWADEIDLVCVDTDGFSVNYYIDTSKLTVICNGIKASNVFIDSGSINFSIEFKNDKYFHMINRSNGNLTIRASDGRQIYGYKCERAKPKF